MGARRSYATLRRNRLSNAKAGSTWDLQSHHAGNCPTRSALCCVKWWGLSALMAVLVGSATHWISSDNGLVVPKEDFPFVTKSGVQSHLIDFLEHIPKLDTYRRQTTELDEILFGRGSVESQWESLPDILSKNADHLKVRPIGNATLQTISSSILLPHKGLNIHDHVDMSAKVSAKKAKQPMCDGTLRHSMADYQHLDGVGDRAKISIDKDERLATAAWRTEFNVSRPNIDMGHYLAVALKANKTSWVLLNLAAMYWRAEGNATQSVECLRRALHHSPYEQRDIALVQLGIILTMANYTDDALIVIEAALDISDTLYATHYAYGNVLTALGSYVQAQEAYERAVELQPDLGAAYSMLASVSAVIKTTAVQSRRKYEINLRKVSMVLSDHLQWEDFEYEAVEDPCFDAVCQKHSTCSKIDGKCHCNEGYLADNQVCKVDKACAVDKCKGNSICRNGRCFCKIGYELEGGMCVKDKCAQVTCVDQAQCNPDDGRCYCAAPYVRRGAECVDPECASVSCQANSVCRLGQCYCLVGYIPKGDACVKDAACTRSSCPAHSTCSDKDGHCRCDADYTADVHRNVCLKADGSEAAEAEPVNLDKPVKLSQGAPDVGSKAGKSGRMLPQTESELVESLSVLPEMCEKMAAGLDELVYSISLYLPLNDSANNEVSAVAAKIMPRKKPSETKSRKLPTCSFSYKVASVHRMDDITDVAAATSSDPPNWAKKVWPDPQARTHLLDLLFRKTGLTPDRSTDTVYAEIGHRIAARLKKDPKNPFTLDLAVLWWRAKGNVVEALKCLQYFLHTASDKHRGSGYAQGANIMLLARRLHGAAIFSELSKSLLPKEPLCLFSHAIIEAASGKLEEAAQSMVELLGDHPKQEVVEDALNRIRCAQFREHQKALENKSTTTTGDFYGEAKDLNQRLKAMQKLLTGTALDDSAKGPELDKIWEQLAEDETRLRRLYEMQQLASKLKQDVADLGSIKDAGGVDVGDQDGRGAAAQKPGHRGRRKLSTREDTTADTGVKVVLHDKAGTATFAADGVDDSDSTDAAAKTKGGSPKVVVVEYPKAPSIPSLIAAVAEMFEKKKDGVSTGVDLPKRLAFEEEGWPSDKDCEAVAANHARFMSTWMSVAAKNVDIHKHIDIVSELETSSSKFQPPICNSPVTAKSVHTLEHLQGMAKRATITMLPEHALREVIRRVNEPRQTADKPPAELPAPLPIDEVGERTRLALKKNATSWVALNIAALYWRVEGNATEALECLRRAFLYSGSSNKDVALVSIANILHLSGYTMDAVTAMQMAIQVAPKMALNHFTLANILFAYGENSAQQAAFFYEATLRFQGEFTPALSRLQQLRCQTKDAG